MFLAPQAYTVSATTDDMIIGFLWGGGVTEAHACYLRVCPCPLRSTARHGLHRELTVQTDGVWGVYSVSV